MVLSTLNKHKWFYPIVAVLITAIVFLPSIFNGWTNWDDEVYVLNNENIRNFSWDNIKYWFQAYHHGNYHPFTMISYMIDYKISELNAKSYHFNNYLLHLLNTFLVFISVEKLTKNKLIGFIVSLLFGIHPMHVESVAWISERKDVLYSSFYLIALVIYLDYKNCPDWRKYSLIILLFICSLMSKSAAVVLPVVLLLIDFFQERKFSTKLIIEKIPFFALSIIFGILAIKSQNATKAIASYETFTTFQRALFAGYGSLIYILKAILPTGLTAFHPYPSLVDNGTRLPYEFYILPVLAILFFGSILALSKKYRIIAFGMFFYLINVALVLQFVSVGSAIFSERYSYMAYIGLFLLFAYGIDYLLNKKPELKTVLIIGVTSVFILFSYLSYNQIKTWKDSISLWTKFNEVHPESKHGMFKIAEYYMNNGNNDAALNQFMLIAQKFPTRAARAHMGIGNIYGKKGKLKKAIEHYNLAEKQDINNNLHELYINRAITYSMLKDYKNAFADYDEAIKRMPDNYQIYINRGFAYLETKNFEKAIENFSIAQKYEPNNPRFYFMKGLAYHQQNNIDKAIKEYNKTLQLNPKHKDAIHNRALCFEAKGDYKKALNEILKAQQLGRKENENYIKKLEKLAQQQ